MIQRRRLRIALFVLGVILAIVAVFFVVREVDWSTVRDALVGADRSYFAAGVLFYFIAKFGLAVRWAALLRTRTHLPVNVSFLHIMIAYFVNNALPFRGGELLRLLLAHRRGGGSLHFYLGSMVIERTIDAAILSLMIVFLGLAMEVPRAVSTAVFTLTGLAFALFFFAFAFPEKRDVILARLPENRVSRYFRQALQDVASSLRLMRTGDLIVAIAFSVLSWGAASVMFFFWQLSFNLNIPWFAAPLQMLSTTLATAIVSTPGGIGVYHQVVISLLGTWDVNRSVAFGFAAATHSVHLLVAIAFGILGVLREQVKGLLHAQADHQ
ncbi:MAG: flippase-like domain-containing protein [Leptospirales bacterium]|nr:flippase-like domain-containing protein [Leptospirales bacterium]